MATLIAYQDGDWTGATTWKAVATGTGASQTTFTTNVPLSTTYTYSPTFTITNGEVIEGVLVRIGVFSTAGTITVALSDDNGVTATREVTVNVSDFASVINTVPFVFFKFATPLTADGGNDYRLGFKRSSNANVEPRRGSTTADFGRLFRTSTTATIAATDVVYICDELTGAGTKTDITVTMNETATTAYGTVTVSGGGVLSYGTSASTNYYLKLSGNLEVESGGTLNIGTSGSRIPSTSTAVLEFNCGSNVQYGLEVRDGSTVNIYGATRTNTKVLLTADANSGQAVVTVEDTTGWAANDEIAIASTTRTASQSEKRTISTVDSGTAVTVSSNLSATHQGTAPYQGEVINLTRNVKIRGMSASLQSYVNCAATSSFTADHAEFYWLGSATAGKRGIDSATTSAGTFTVQDCSIHDFVVASSRGINATSTSGSSTIDGNVAFNIAAEIFVTASTTGTNTVTNNWCLGVTAGSNGFQGYGGADQFTGNRGVSCAFGAVGFRNLTSGTIANCVFHSNGSGARIDASGTISNISIWRNTNDGLIVNLASNAPQTFDSCSFFHNNPRNVYVTTGNPFFLNCTFDGGTGQSLAVSSNDIVINNNGYTGFANCTFGATNPSSGLIAFVGARYVNYVFTNCAVGSLAPTSAQAGNLRDAVGAPSAVIAFDKFNQTSGSHRAYKQYGYTASDQSTFRTAAPSEALIPNNASNKLPSGSKKFAVANGGARTVTVYVNKSATYNGNQPRLIVKRNIVGGITTDTVLATASGGTGSWLTLTGTTATVTDDCVLEVYVDCDGTAGTVYVDDWSVS